MTPEEFRKNYPLTLQEGIKSAERNGHRLSEDTWVKTSCDMIDENQWVMKDFELREARRKVEQEFLNAYPYTLRNMAETVLSVKDMTDLDRAGFLMDQLIQMQTTQKKMDEVEAMMKAKYEGEGGGNPSGFLN